jgi:hypothetical protein
MESLQKALQPSAAQVKEWQKIFQSPMAQMEEWQKIFQPLTKQMQELQKSLQTFAAQMEDRHVRRSLTSAITLGCPPALATSAAV